MNFVHEEPDFGQLLQIVAQARGIGIALIEKDYWVTHVLWSLMAQGFEVWFKGGTSLSKGFGLIERFSEDLDLKIEPGRVTGLVPIRPKAVCCVHPLVTLLEKLDALQKHVPSERAPADFVRHFEDASRLARMASSFGVLTDYVHVRALAEELLGQRQIRALPTATHAAFTPVHGERWSAIESAYEAIGPMFWGARVSLREACADVRQWVGDNL